MAEPHLEKMNTYVIRREKAWQSPAELEATAARSKEVAESDFRRTSAGSAAM